MKSIISLLFFILVPATVFAASGHGDGGIPVDTIKWQVINFVIFAGGMYWILKHKMDIPLLFKTRRAQYTELVEKAESAKTEAEAVRKEFHGKLTTLEAEAASVNEKARQEALELKEKMLREAGEISERLIKDAQSVAMYELEKAKIQLKAELVEESMDSAQAKLKEKVSDSDRSKLRNDFVDKIQVVQ